MHRAPHLLPKCGRVVPSSPEHTATSQRSQVF
jgi:hypothetical protein